MKNFILFILSTLLFSNISFAQNEPEKKREKIKLYYTGGAGVSYFHYDVRNLNKLIHGRSYKFMAPSFRMGMLAEIPIYRNFSITTGLRVGVRLKRESIYEVSRQRGLIYPYTFDYLDEEVSDFNSYSVEIPFGVQYSKGKIKVGVAGIYRDQGVNFDLGAELSNRGEIDDIGLVPSVSYAFNKNIAVGLEYYFGKMMPRFNSVHNDNGQDIYYGFSTRMAQFTIRYKMRR